jgi:23S rRNA (pseudouridine1915-N3)-methyltransferase
MRLDLAYISPRRQRLKSAPAQALIDEFIKRAGRYIPTRQVPFDSEAVLLASLDRLAGKSPVTLILLDSRGEALSSEQIAAKLGHLRDTGTQHVLYAVGPADGWSAAAYARADARLSFGAITLPHELALVVLAEQLYRALSILAGHPYHAAHT